MARLLCWGALKLSVSNDFYLSISPPASVLIEYKIFPQPLVAAIIAAVAANFKMHYPVLYCTVLYCTVPYCTGVKTCGGGRWAQTKHLKKFGDDPMTPTDF